jgi:hypothetical protein
MKIRGKAVDMACMPMFDRRSTTVLVLGTLVALAVGGAVRPQHEGLETDAFLFLAGLALAGFILAALVPRSVEGPGRSSGWVALLVGVAVSGVLYLLPTSVGGKGDFQLRALLAAAVLAAWIAASWRHWRRPRLALFSAMAGIFVLPLLLVGFLFAACPDGGCFS